MILALIFPLLSACASRGIPPTTASGEQPEARALLQKSAEAHGLAAWLQIRDLSVSYVGEWRSLVTRLQPTLIDPDFRQASEERLLLDPQPIYAQHHQGPKGSKQVVRTASEVNVFYNGTPSNDRDVQAAAALKFHAALVFSLCAMTWAGVASAGKAAGSVKRSCGAG
jgi:hypothetical protein